MDPSLPALVGRRRCRLSVRARPWAPLRATSRLTLRVRRAAKAACKARDADGDSRRGARRNCETRCSREPAYGFVESIATTDAFITTNWGALNRYALEQRSARRGMDYVLCRSCPPCGSSHFGRGTRGLGVCRRGGTPKFLRDLFEDARATCSTPSIRADTRGVNQDILEFRVRNCDSIDMPRLSRG